MARERSDTSDVAPVRLGLEALLPKGTTRLPVVDMHCAGEPVRIFAAQSLMPSGRSLLELRKLFASRHDWVRQALMLEPRGHAEMYGAFLVHPPEGREADAAALFIHCSGYSTMCGHATLALGRYLFDRGRADGGAQNSFRLETPCGLTTIMIESAKDGAPLVSFDGTESFALLNQRVQVPGFGSVEFDLGFGGAYYAILPASYLGLRLPGSSLQALSEAAGALVTAIRHAFRIDHPNQKELGFLYGAILTDGAFLDSGDVSQNLCWFGEGQLDRSPTGSGLAARVAVEAARGLFGADSVARVSGLSGETFEARLAQPPTKSGVVVRISGKAYYTSFCRARPRTWRPLSAGLYGHVRLRTVGSSAVGSDGIGADDALPFAAETRTWRRRGRGSLVSNGERLDQGVSHMSEMAPEHGH